MTKIHKSPSLLNWFKMASNDSKIKNIFETYKLRK